jgi:hypothetical protein
MNNNDDYLWDRSGQPDPEIQQLEEILGTLRYQPRPLEIPAEVQVERQRNFFRGLAPRLAIAATIALLLLGLGVWIGLQRFGRVQPVAIARHGTPAPVPSPGDNRVAAPLPEDVPKQKVIETPRQQPAGEFVPAGYSGHPRHQSRTSLRNRLIAAREEKEAEAAKDQLLLALRLTSAKLNYAQKKAQSPNPRELIHNQHKIG